MTLCADAAGVDNLSFLNDDQLLELLENSDLEDFDIDEEDVPQLQLAVANEMEADPQRCPSPLNSDIPLQVRMEQEKLRQRWRIKPWETPIVAPIIELPVSILVAYIIKLRPDQNLTFKNQSQVRAKLFSLIIVDVMSGTNERTTKNVLQKIFF
ncbi:uncharacterized protein LOC124370604 [Homalodisca vitripennis]|uniref:uncharacterized protein LOC124370604 n=1 Tax=Homalodisca vitripennis TaxID=197043 RepID=UPI001EEA1515|nr:uncharacterized protein LOC124370604 [Homalodisca vitripennis]